MRLLCSFFRALRTRRLYTTVANEISLRGKHFCGRLATKEELESLLWSARDMKHLYGIGAMPQRLLWGRRICLLTMATCVNLQPAAVVAASDLGAQLDILYIPHLDSLPYLEDVGYMLALQYDLILTYTRFHYKALKISSGSSVPVVSVCSGRYMLFAGLLHLFTLVEQLGSVRGLRMAWLGPPNSLINTYLRLMPYFGINIVFTCSAFNNLSIIPSEYAAAKALGGINSCDVAEGKDMEETVSGSDIICLSCQGKAGQKIRLDQVDGFASPKWVFLMAMPRKFVDVVEPSLLYHERSLAWPAHGNARHLFASLFSRLLEDYDHVTDKPNF